MNKAKVREILEITLGVVIMSLGFYFFLLPLNLIVGGVMGISVLLQNVIPVSVFIYIANILLLIVGLIFLGKVFFMKTFYATILSPTIIWVLEKTVDANLLMQYMTESPLLIAALFGALSVGVGLGMVLRNNATTGGIDVLQKMLHKYLNIPFHWALYLIDGTIILVALFLDFQNGLYAIGTMLLSGVIIDRISIEGQSGFTAFIVTNESDKIKDQVYKLLDRGVTISKVFGGYSREEKDMIICTVDRRQLYHFTHIIKETDPKAFTFVTRTKEALGNGFSRELAVWEQKN
ncbi:YitT family protein [Mycoplasmatota bacterium]|nr:YitT family protein [Mycoplasmatota bacterium]